jgi:hypothetical protein
MTNEQIQKSQDYKHTFSTEHGVKVLEDLDKQCLFTKDIFDPMSDRVTSFNLGKNAVIRYIHQEINKKLTEEENPIAIHKEIN